MRFLIFCSSTLLEAAPTCTHELPFREEREGRNTHDTELCGFCPMDVYVHLCEEDLISVFLGKFLHDGSDHSAGRSPKSTTTICSFGGFHQIVNQRFLSDFYLPNLLSLPLYSCLKLFQFLLKHLQFSPPYFLKLLVLPTSTMLFLHF